MDTENNTEINNIPHRSYTPEEISQSYSASYQFKSSPLLEDTTSYYTVNGVLIAILDILFNGIGVTTYWFYRNFRAIDRAQDKSAFFSLTKSVLAPFFAFQIFKKVEEDYTKLEINNNINARVLSNFYLTTTFIIPVSLLIFNWVAIIKILDSIEKMQFKNANIYILIFGILLILYIISRFISFIPLIMVQKRMLILKQKLNKSNDGHVEIGKFLLFIIGFIIVYILISTNILVFLLTSLNKELERRTEQSKEKLDILMEEYRLKKENEEKINQ